MKKPAEYRIQPDGKYWAIARAKHYKLGRVRWDNFCYFAKLEQAAVYLLNMVAAEGVATKCDTEAIMDAIVVAEGRVLSELSRLSLSSHVYAETKPIRPGIDFPS